MISLQIVQDLFLRYQQRKNACLESIRGLVIEQRPYQGLSTGQIDQRQFYLRWC